MKKLSCLALTLLMLLPVTSRAAGPLISEFMAANGGTLLDENGDSSDWIEIYNNGTDAVNLAGWRLTDRADDLAQWTFPATNLTAGRFLIVFASGKDRTVPGAPLHANFQLDSAGEYLALVQPDGQIAHQFAPIFPPQVEGISYGTELNVTSTRLVTNGVLARWIVPLTAADQPADWASTNFVDAAWNSGPTALGFDAGSSNIFVNGTATNLALGKPATQSSTLGGFTPDVAVNGNTADFTHTAGGQNLPSTWEVNLGTNYGIERIVLNNRSSCCGSRLRDITVRILDATGATNYTSALLNPENTLGSGLNGPATLSLNLTQLTGGLVIGGRVRVTRTPDPDLSGSGGQGNADEADVLSLAEVEVFGVPASGSFNSLIQTDLAAAMRNVNASALLRLPFVVVAEELPVFDQLTLRMKYDDGFAAYLNGVKVAEANAPASLAWNSAATAEHADALAFLFEDFDLTAHQGLLQDGVNVLAIQGLNLTAADDDFLVLPELTGVAVSVAAERYFTQPTPGVTNAAGSLGLVADTKFSVDRGFFDVPFTVAITTATDGAEIRYTTNGSAPSATSGILYTGPIQISRTTVLRAIATKPGYTPTDVDTHSYIFPNDVVAQSQQSVINAGYPSTWTGVGADYAMDTRITASNVTQMVPSLRSLPSLFISTSISNLFDANTGIYSHPTSHGLAWERAASLEMVDTNGATEFQENCGVRIQGGYFRDPNVTQKHSMRVLFKSQYGAGKLQHDLFKTDDAVTEFDGLVLRAGANDGYAWNEAKDTEQFTRDQFGRGLHQSMGHPAPHGLFVHLYLNGVYWGLYNLVERANEDFSASYFGGDPLEWDSNNAGDMKSGDLTAWNAFTSQTATTTTLAAYQRLQGNNPDGSRNAAFPVYLDKLNYIDYMIANIWGGNWDWPNKNFWFGRLRTTNSTGFKFYMWDFENTMGNNRARSPVNMVSPRSGIENSWVGQPHNALKSLPEYRIDFADRVQRYFFNGGLLTPGVLTNRYRATVDPVELSIYAETARWGDDNLNPPQDIDDWRRERDWMLGTYLPQRSDVVMQQFRSAGLYPNVGAPAFSQLGGEVPDGYPLELSHTNATGTLYFTTDGSDPRMIGGAVNPSAQVYFAPIAVTTPINVRARVLVGTNWSAIVEGILQPPQDFSRLLLTEIMYHPPAVGLVDGDDFEFLELKNTDTKGLNLSGRRFTDGISFTFRAGTILGPGQFLVLARNAAQFAAKYPGATLHGVYDGSLANGGETITLSHPFGGTVLSVTYDDLAPWPVTPDDFGFSLVPKQPNTNPDPDNGTNWRASSTPGGSPGADDPATTISPVLINEVLSHSSTSGDSIELFNPTAGDVNIGGWFLTDDPGAPQKFRIPNGTTIAALGHLVFDESAFNPTPGTNNSFALEANGDEVYLFSGDANTNLTGYSHGFSFGASADGDTLGRYVISTGEEHFPIQTAATPNAPNAGPRVGPVTITEIMYHPIAGGDEFIELKNISLNAVALFDEAVPTNTWRVNGLGYDFPTNLVIGPGETLLLVATNAATFRARHGIPPNVQIFGPFAGQLQDSGERLELQRPGTPTTNGVPFFTVDEVRYNDRVPWPTAADGSGPSLQRKVAAAYGNDAANWTAATATPGADFPGGEAPAIVTPPQNQSVVVGQPVTLSVIATGASPLNYQWSRNGDILAGATGPNLLFLAAQLTNSGNYSVVVFNAAGSTASTSATLTVRIPPRILTNPTNTFVRLGSNGVFTVNAAGNGLLRYQWRFNGTNIAAATNVMLTVSNVTFNSAGDYTVEITDLVGPVLSVPASLIIAIDPIIVQNPLSQMVVSGATVVLSVSVTNTATLPMGYRLRRNNASQTNFFEVNSRTFFFVISNAQPQFTNYSFICTNGAKPGGNNSANALLTFVTDTDGDGLPDNWEASFFGGATAANRDVDSDGDGLLNREEYIAGTNPTNALSYLRIDSITRTGGATLAFGAISNRTYTVQSSDLLDTGPWARLADIGARATNRTETVVDASYKTNRFYRVVTPLTP